MKKKHIAKHVNKVRFWHSSVFQIQLAESHTLDMKKTMPLEITKEQERKILHPSSFLKTKTKKKKQLSAVISNAEVNKVFISARSYRKHTTEILIVQTKKI